MDATCNVQDSIHVFHLVHNMCPGFWVHINLGGCVLYIYVSIKFPATDRLSCMTY